MTRLKLIGITLALPIIVVFIFIGEYYDGLSASQGTHGRAAKNAFKSVKAAIKNFPEEFRYYWKE